MCMYACMHISTYHHLSIFSTACYSPSVSNRNRFKDAATYCFRDRPPAPQRSPSPVPGNIKLCTSLDDHPNLLQTKHILPHSFGKGLLSFTLQEGTSSTDVWSPIGRALRLDLLLGITHLIEASTIACLAPQSGWYGSQIGDLYIYAFVYRYICICMCVCVYVYMYLRIYVEIGSFVHHLQ